MEGNPIFSNTAQVEIQGNRVLRFIALNETWAEYQVIGFGDLIITVKDYRPVGLRAIAGVLKTESTDEFAPQFNMPSHVTISTLDSSNILIELRETDDSTPAHMLWVAIGVEEYIPVYDYVFERIAPLDDRRFAFLALYQRPPRLEELAFPPFSVAC